MGGGPTGGDRAEVFDDLAVARPDKLDGFGGADPGGAGVSGGAKPVILRCASRACAKPNVGGAVDGVSEDFVLKEDIVGDDGSSKVEMHTFAGFENEVDLGVSPFGEDLEGSEDLGANEVEVVGFEDLVEGDEDSSRLDRAVERGDLVVGQRFTAKDDVGAWDRKEFVFVVEKFGGGHREDGSDGQVGEGTSGGKFFESVKEAELEPAGVGKEDGLGGAFLPACGVGVLVGLPSDVGKGVFGGIGSEDLPVESGIFDKDLAFELDRELFGNAGASGELERADLGFFEDQTHDPTATVDQIDIGKGKTAGVEEADELLHDHRGGGGIFEEDFIAHVEGTEHLEGGDLEGEVERRDDSDRAVRPAVSLAFLADVIARVVETASQKANAVACKVFKKKADDGDFAHRLGVAFRHDPLDAASKEVCDFGDTELLSGLCRDIAVESVAFYVFERVV